MRCSSRAFWPSFADLLHRVSGQTPGPGSPVQRLRGDPAPRRTDGEPMVTLYYAPGTCSLVTHTALHEAGAEHEARRVDLMKGEHRTPEYLAINPHGRVPALVTDEGAITENIAILGYLADRFGAPGSLPRGDAYKTAKDTALLTWLSVTVHTAGFGAFFRPARFTADESLHAGIKEG